MLLYFEIMLEWVLFTVQYLKCEGKSSPLLECNAGQVIMVSDASYGRTDSLVCPHPTVVSSRTYDGTVSTTTGTKKNCDLKQSCLPSRNGAVDPLPNVYKYMNVTHKCLISGTNILFCFEFMISLFIIIVYCLYFLHS